MNNTKKNKGLIFVLCILTMGSRVHGMDAWLGQIPTWIGNNTSLTVAIPIGLYMGYRLVTHNTGPVTANARDIEARIADAVLDIKFGVTDNHQSPLEQLANAFKGLVELRLALSDALYGLPERYNNTVFLQECCDRLDILLHDPEVAYTFRYVAQRDKALQTYIKNIGVTASFEHLAGLNQAMQGKNSGIISDIASAIQWVRSGFDPLDATARSATVAAQALVQKAHDGLQVLTGYPMSLEKRENQVKMLEKIRASLFASDDQRTWFEHLANVTGVPRFLHMCIRSKKQEVQAESKKDVASGTNSEYVTPNGMQEVKQAEVQDLTHNTINTKISAQQQPMYKRFFSLITEQARKHSFITNVATCAAICACCALVIRNYQVVGNRVAATTRAVYQRAKAAVTYCCSARSHNRTSAIVS